jgi:hypothetical protein
MSFNASKLDGPTLATMFDDGLTQHMLSRSGHTSPVLVMWLLTVGPNERVDIALAQDAMLETMSLYPRWLNNGCVGPPSGLAHDEALHALPGFRSPGMPDPSSMAEENSNSAGLVQSFVVAA